MLFYLGQYVFVAKREIKGDKFGGEDNKILQGQRAPDHSTIPRAVQFYIC